MGPPLRHAGHRLGYALAAQHRRSQCVRCFRAALRDRRTSTQTAAVARRNAARSQRGKVLLPRGHQPIRPRHRRRSLHTAFYRSGEGELLCPLTTPFGQTFCRGHSFALTPNLANLQVIGGKCYCPRQFSPSVNGSDLFESIARSQIKGVQFVDDWLGYHRFYGEVHCGSLVKSSLPKNNWWQNQPKP